MAMTSGYRFVRSFSIVAPEPPAPPRRPPPVPGHDGVDALADAKHRWRTSTNRVLCRPLHPRVGCR
jgi:hypothetical protein